MIDAIDLVNYAAAATGLVIVLLGLIFTVAVRYLET